MRNRLLKCSLLVAVLAMVTVDVDAQQKKPNRPSTTRKSTTNKKPPAKKANTSRNNNAANNAALAAAPKDTVKPVAALEAELKIDAPRKSLRNDNAVERNLVKDRTPLNYEHIREDDATYMQRVWREIDVHEKMNLPFVYKAEGEYGNQRFIMVLLNAIKNDSIVAFDANVDDRFTTPLPFNKIAEALIGKPRIEQIPDWAKDPTGATPKDTLITEIFNPDAIERFWIKEDVVFDKESSRMYTRILGIAPLKTINNADGSFRAVTPLFWVYYPDLRPILAKQDVYNAKNYGAKMSWEELFESRMFASRIVKSTINNSNDMLISNYIKDPILALLEGENVKERIFNYEQDLWSY